ncbi:MAG: O-antigen ligase family protein, partial [Deltaproteobacteria bacterium]|nr:O-antigen ligase family protein [Deltaproteobacteria bacterium]
LVGNRGFYRAIFLGALWGAVLSAVVGLLDYYGVISLTGFRPLDRAVNPGSIQYRLQSIFGHPGWFAEFVTVTIPFILVGFVKKDRGFLWKVFLFGILVLCEIALILAKSRAGWISYPMTLTFCWISVYLLREEGGLKTWHIKRKDIIKIAVSVPITIILSLFIVFKLFGVSSSLVKEKTTNEVAPSHMESNLVQPSNVKPEAAGPSNVKPKPRKLTAVERKAKQDSLENRFSNILKASDRTTVWKQGYGIGLERPIFGMGYESFGWHMGILRNVEKSNIRLNGSYRYKYDTPHNLYLQLFVSGGFVGLFLWGLLVVYVLAVLVADLIRKNRYFNVCVALSIVSFHVYGVFQSMQYIPMIWFLILLMFGYALTIDGGVLPLSIRRFARVLSMVGIVLVLVGGVVYLNNFESRKLVEKYGLEAYRQDQDKNRYFGFYPLLHGKYRGYRWSGKRAAIDINGGGTVEIEFKCDTPDVEKDPVVLSVYENDDLLDTVSFTKKGTIRRKYTFPETPGETVPLTLEVSRTWNPHKFYGNFDRKDLGVGVRILGK